MGKALVLDCPVVACGTKIVIPYTIQLQPEMRDVDIIFDTSVFRGHVDSHRDEDA